MRAMMSLINAIVAIAPVAFVAIIALPVAGVGVRLTHVAENSNFHPLLGIILTHKYMWRCCRFSQGCHWPAIPVSDENMGMLMIWRIATFRRFPFVSWPSSPAESIPMLASSAKAVATETYVVLPIIATCTIVVKLVLYVILSAALACYVRLGVQNRSTK